MTDGRSLGAQQVVAWCGGVVFVASLLYFVWCYAWGFGSTSVASTATVWPPAVTDVILFSIFALHHSWFARAGVKGWITRHVRPALERSAYVWIASVLFILTCALWQPVPGVVWRVTGPGGVALAAGQWLAGVAAVVSARRLDVLELAGIRQVLGGATFEPHALERRGAYRWVRHPIYSAWLLMVCLAPHMNGTRLVFAVVSCAYLFVAVPYEERDLVRVFGPAYQEYQKTVRWRIVPFLF
jgi:protein-S-isoprenylcysteine O-methyltransferase Ste14